MSSVLATKYAINKLQQQGTKLINFEYDTCTSIHAYGIYSFPMFVKNHYLQEH